MEHIDQIDYSLAMFVHTLSIHPLGSSFEGDLFVKYHWEKLEEIYFEFQIPQKYFSLDINYSKSNFTAETYRGNWGLWEKRPVVEAFFQKRTHPQDISSAYYEFQVSPFKEYFLAKVHKPREVYSTPLDLPIDCEISFQAQSSSNQQNMNIAVVKVRIDLSLLCDGEGEWYGNFYTILPSIKQDESKIYAGLNLDFQKLDFHLPAIFKRL